MTCKANPITWQLPAVLIYYLCRIAFTSFLWTQTKTASAAVFRLYWYRKILNSPR